MCVHEQVLTFMDTEVDTWCLPQSLVPLGFIKIIKKYMCVCVFVCMRVKSQ